MLFSSSDISESMTDLKLKLWFGYRKVGGWCSLPSLQKAVAGFTDGCGLLFPGDFITSVYML